MMPLDDNDVIRLSLLPRVGPSRGRALLARFRSWAGICAASAHDLAEVGGIGSGLAVLLHATCRDRVFRNDVERIIERNEALRDRLGARFIPCSDSAYPEMLARIYDPPLYLFRLGDDTADDVRAVAVVGTREPSDYGRRVAASISGELARRGVTVVSGLALGIDTVAHDAALREGGRSIAVLGSGLNRVYPWSNRRLAERVAASGCLFSELHLDAKPDAVNFPRRNRIISGLCAATVIVESGVSGGAIITARMALDQNREVFSVPGSILNPASAGTNLLLKKGEAHMLADIEDLFEQLPQLRGGSARGGTAPVVPPPAVQLTLIEQTVLAALSQDPLHIDELASRTGLGTPDLLVELLQLEFAGLARQLAGKHFTTA